MSVKTAKITRWAQTVQTASKALTTTSRRNKGFTLIEILIVVAIIAMVLAIGMPAIERVTYQRLNSTTRRFVGLMHTIRNDAILLNNIYRLAIDLDREQYWVEMQRELKPLDVEEPKEKKKNKKGEEPPSNFLMAQKFGNSPTKLPGGIVVNSVLKESEGLRKQGVVFIHFFPSGFTEQAIIHLGKEGDEGGGYSLVVRPSLGKVDILNQKVTSFATVQ